MVMKLATGDTVRSEHNTLVSALEKQKSVFQQRLSSVANFERENHGFAVHKQCLTQGKKISTQLESGQNTSASVV